VIRHVPLASVEVANVSAAADFLIQGAALPAPKGREKRRALA
jgi:hypothetical protein